MMAKQFLGMAAIALLVACNSNPSAPLAEEGPSAAPASNQASDQAEAAPATPSTPTPAPTAESASVALAPDTYCYTINTDDLTGAVRLTVDEAGQVGGDSSVAIHNDAAGYYSSYAQTFQGSLSGDRANLEVTTWIEYDRQTDTENWIVTSNTLTVSNDTFTAADCQSDAVALEFAGPDGLEGADLLEGLLPGERVEFAPGTSGTVLENSVVRGDRDLYVLGAQGGQQMTLNITALEDNAVFDVVSPSGYILLREAVSETLFLPQTGDYKIIVGGTRGNATYSLDVAIK